MLFPGLLYRNNPLLVVKDFRSPSAATSAFSAECSLFLLAKGELSRDTWVNFNEASGLFSCLDGEGLLFNTLKLFRLARFSNSFRFWYISGVFPRFILRNFRFSKWISESLIESPALCSCWCPKLFNVFLAVIGVDLSGIFLLEERASCLNNNNKSGLITLFLGD